LSVVEKLQEHNIEALGSPGSGQWNDAVDVIQRMGADVVAIQEVAGGEQATFPSFASQAGYANQVVSSISGTMSGNLRLAVMSTYPIVFSQSHSAVDLSGDPNANDITRDIFEAHIQVTGASTVLGVFVVHLKAGSGNDEDFRRTIELIRVQQALSAFQVANPGAAFALVGDMNEDIGDGPFGSSFSSMPGGMPASYNLGNDITFPVVYQPFTVLTNLGLSIADATQEDSTTLYVTRAISGRRLDYVFLHGPIQPAGDEVYNSIRDNGIDDPPLGNWLTKIGNPLPSGTSVASSDHFSVFGDYVLAAGPAGPAPHTLGDIVVSEYMNDPAAVFDSVGEWLELFNTTGAAINLAGFTIRDQGSDAFALPSLVIPSRGYVVLARSGDFSQNGGVVADHAWPVGSFLLANSADEIEVVDVTGAVLDSVVYGGGAFPSPTGKSVERRDSTALPWATNFGEATIPFGAGDLGTPGGPNSISLNPLFTHLGLTGPLTPGSTAFLTVSGGPSLVGRPYFLAASECTGPGILFPVSGRVLDLCTSSVFDLSLTPGNPFFINFSGTLNVFGIASASVAIPNVPALSGLTLFVSGVVIDPIFLESVASIVDQATLTIN